MRVWKHESFIRLPVQFTCTGFISYVMFTSYGRLEVANAGKLETVDPIWNGGAKAFRSR
jgi:hypothetical protein